MIKLTLAYAKLQPSREYPPLTTAAPPQNFRPSSQSQRLALNALLAGAFGIACAPIFVRFSQVGPSATAFWRLFLAMPFLWAWMQRARASTGHRPPRGRADMTRLLLAGLFFAGDLGIWHWSIKYTTVANATLLVNFAPVFVALGSWLLFGQRVSGRFVLGMALSLAGVAGVIGGGFRLNTGHLLGDLLGLTSALFYAGYLLWVHRLRQEFSTAVVMVWSGIGSSLLLLLAAWLLKETLLPVDLQGWMVLLALALISQVGGQTLIAFALARLPAALSSVTLLLQPVLAAVFAWLLLGEALSSMELLFGLLTLLGIFLARRATSLA